MAVRGALLYSKIAGVYPYRHAAWWLKPGRFELSDGQLRWTQVLRNRSLTLPIDEIRSITLRPVGARTSVEVATARGSVRFHILSRAPFRALLEEAGLEVHTRPAWPHVEIVVHPGTPIDWTNDAGPTV